MIQDGLILHYKLDESTGASSTRDESKDGRHGVISGSPVFSAQFNSNGIIFDGTDDSILVPAGFSMPTNKFSISFWYKQLAWETNDRLIDWQDSGPQNGFTFVQTGSSGILQCAIRNGSTLTASLNTADISSGRHHIVVTFNGSIATMYVDNVQVAQDVSTVMAAAAVQMTLGKRAGASTNYINAEMDDLRIWNRDLSASEIEELFLGGGFPSSQRLRKQYQYKVYSKEGEFLATWTDVINDPEFTTVINGGFVELVVKLARKTADFGELEDVNLGNEVQVWCFDNDMPSGVKIFSGYISRYDPITKGIEEEINVHALGYHTVLNDFMYENAQGTTELAHNSRDPGEIAEAVIDALANNGCPITWDETTLQKTGTVTSYTFQANMGLECMDKILELTPASWYWYVDADKKFHLHPKSEVVHHKFTVGKEVFDIQPQKRIENIINRIYFIGGVPTGQGSALYGRYERQASIQIYGLKSIKKTDQRVKLQSTMDTIANTILDQHEQIELRNIVRVRDNNTEPTHGYDIESIKVGDICNIRNYANQGTSSRWDVMVWDQNYWDFDLRNMAEIDMQIVEIRYRPGFAELVLSSRLPTVSKRIEDIERNLETTISENNPVSPFLGS